MATPNYTAVYDRAPIYRGDTLVPLSITITDEDGSPVIPESVCCEARNAFGQLVHSFDTDIDAETGAVIIGPMSAEESRQLPVGALVYDVQYTFAGGVVRTYVRGAITIVQDISQCK